MAITTDTYVDQTTVTEIGVVHYRLVTAIFRDGSQIGKTYERFTLTPGSNLTDAPDSVKAICNVVWTPEIVAKYNAPREDAV